MKDPLQSFDAVDAAFPGFTAVAGPFGVDSRSKATQSAEKAACVRSYRNQRDICLKARIVLHHGKAWIIRKKPLELDNNKRHKLLVSGDLGIYALGMRSA